MIKDDGFEYQSDALLTARLTRDCSWPAYDVYLLSGEKVQGRLARWLREDLTATDFDCLRIECPSDSHAMLTLASSEFILLSPLEQLSECAE